MFNLKYKTQIDQVQIIGDNSRSKFSNAEHAAWGVGFEKSAQRDAKAENQQKPATENQFRVRIYNVY